MQRGRGSELLSTLRTLAGGGRSEDRPDGALLERYARAGDPDAFAALVQRHGPLVWGVCRRVLRHDHAAEDAFQATFLVLARSAAAVRRAESVRSWLYGVALRVALRARSRADRRCEAPAVDPPATTDSPDTSAGRAELTAALDEEIRRLPDRYRLPLVLCYLLGRTNDEAASELGCPRGTVAVRLARGRERLRQRLLRRGLGPVAALPALPALSAVPRHLAVAAVPGGPPSESVSILAKGVLTSMFFDKCKAIVFAALAAGALLAAGIGGRSLLAQPPAAAPDKDVSRTAAAEKAAGPLPDLLNRRQKAAQAEYTARYELLVAGRGDVRASLDASQRLLNATLELSHKKEREVAAWEESVERLKTLLDLNQERYKIGQCGIADLEQSRYFYLDAQIELERARTR